MQWAAAEIFSLSFRLPPIAFHLGFLGPPENIYRLVGCQQVWLNLYCGFLVHLFCNFFSTISPPNFPATPQALPFILCYLTE